MVFCFAMVKMTASRHEHHAPSFEPPSARALQESHARACMIAAIRNTAALQRFMETFRENMNNKEAEQARNATM